MFYSIEDKDTAKIMHAGRNSKNKRELLNEIGLTEEEINNINCRIIKHARKLGNGRVNSADVTRAQTNDYTII